jgi:hypothetical protein
MHVVFLTFGQRLCLKLHEANNAIGTHRLKNVIANPPAFPACRRYCGKRQTFRARLFPGQRVTTDSGP